MFEQRTIAHAGPLPDPQTLREYDQLVPMAAARIIKMAEKDQDFKHTYYLSEQKHRAGVTKLGQVFGFLLGIIAICATVVLAMNDKPISGSAVFIGAVGTLIGTAVWSKNKNSVQK